MARPIPRTAAFAWSHSVEKPLVVTGTRAGALDADFSTETRLEIWEAAVGADGSEAKPIASTTTDSRFYDIAWSQPTKDYPNGVIAGALESGAIVLWDAAKLTDNASDAEISKATVHSGAVKALQFNPHRPELLASCGAKGELFITDLNNPQSPYRVGTNAVRSDDFDCLDWNKRVPHILVTGSSTGFVTVWDVKKKAENLTLTNYNRKPVSAVAWHPDEPTKLVTATSADQEPLILLWQLRNTSQPEKIFKAHDQGVLSLSWCAQDSGLLLSSGKDNRNICWDTESAQPLGEFPIVTNWTFQTRFSPTHPDTLATAAFDGKIVFQSLQNVKTTSTDGATQEEQAADGEDFFAQAQSKPVGSTFSLAAAPKWLRRPVGVSFGFGGKLVRLSTTSGDATKPSKSAVSITTFTSDESVSSSITQFASTLNDLDVSKICQSHIDSSDEGGTEDWKVMQTLVADKPRKELLNYLGFEPGSSVTKESSTSEATKDAVNGEMAGDSAQKKENGFSAFFDDEDGDDKNFLTDIAASKGASTNNPFHIFSGSESQSDKDITKALMLGAFDQALDVCLKENRMSDAFMIAICGGQKCIDKAQAAYFAQQTGAPNYLRLLASVVGKNLWDIVHNADLENWREVMATFCTFADSTEFPDLCEALGQRLEQNGAPQQDASFCYLAGSKLDKLVPIWIDEMQKDERAKLSQLTEGSEFAVHVKSLQDFIEKISIFRKATQYEDKDSFAQTSGWKLEKLYEKYAEYADIAATNGNLTLAEQLLALLPPQFPAADAARKRISQASRTTTVPSTRTQQRAQPVVVPTSTTPVNSGVAPTGRAPSVYQPQSSFTPVPSTYTPTGNLAANAPRTGGIYAPPMPAFNTASTASPPPPAVGPPPSGPPGASKAMNGENWNDLPEAWKSKQSVSRSRTPAAVSSPFPNQPVNQFAPPTATGPPLQQRASPSIQPPPKAGMPRSGSPLVGRPGPHPAVDHPPRPPSTSVYAPQMPSQNILPSSPLASVPPPRIASPYQAPPPSSNAPPSSRYAPAPGSTVSPAPGNAAYGGRPPVAPRPFTAQTTASPYAPQAGFQAAPGPPMSTGPPPTGPPPTSKPPPGPPPTGPPRGGPPRSSSVSTATPPPPPAAASTPTSQMQYPAGDRTHISATARPIFEILDREMQRIQSKAPASFKARVDDTARRVNLMFDVLNNGILSSEAVELLNQITKSFQSRNFEQAQSLYEGLVKQVEEGSQWTVGLKRLIAMSKATPL